MPALGPINLSTPLDPDVGLKQLDVVADALRSIASAGIYLPAKPTSDFDGTIPPLANLSDDELGDLLNKVSNWCGFVETELSQVESALEVSKSQLEFLQSNVRIALRAHAEGRMTVQDKTDAMNNDERIAAAQSKYLFHFTKYNVLKSIRNMAQRGWETVSRRITQRGQGIDRMKRGENITSTPIRTPFKR